MPHYDIFLYNTSFYSVYEVLSSRDPNFLKNLEEYMNKVKPEAAYFLPLDGDRAMAFILNIDNNYQVPSLVEPLFQRMGAKVEVIPVMNFDDLKKGISI